MKKIGALVIVFSMLFNITIAPIFGANVIDSSRATTTDTTYYTDTDGSVHVFAQCYSIDPYVDNVVSTPTTSSTGTKYDISFNVVQEYVIAIRLYNTTDDIYKFNRGLVGVYPQRPAAANTGAYLYDGTGYELKEIQGNVFGNISISTNGNILCYGSYEWLHGNMITLPSKCSIYTFFSVLSIDKYHINNSIGDVINMNPSDFDRPVSSISIVYPESASINNDAYLYNINYNSYLTEEKANEIYQSLITTNSNLANIDSSLNNIESNVQIITDAYTNNSTNTTSTQSAITSTDTNEQQLHQAEQNFYQQNEQALNNVGLSNFSFSGDQSSGLGSVITDFTTLWNNIGPLQIIFTFTLSMSLATFLLRHRPITGAIKKNEKR